MIGSSPGFSILQIKQFAYSFSAYSAGEVSMNFFAAPVKEK